MDVWMFYGDYAMALVDSQEKDWHSLQTDPARVFSV